MIREKKDVTAISSAARIYMRPSSKFPDPEICKTRHDFSNYWECLEEKLASLKRCPYLRKMGLYYYCTYPESWSFASEE
jgi:hypothetical protein